MKMSATDSIFVPISYFTFTINFWYGFIWLIKLKKLLIKFFVQLIIGYEVILITKIYILFKIKIWM